MATVDETKQKVEDGELSAQDAYDLETAEDGENRSTLTEWLLENGATDPNAPPPEGDGDGDGEGDGDAGTLPGGTPNDYPGETAPEDGDGPPSAETDEPESPTQEAGGDDDPYGRMPMQQRPQYQDDGVKGEDAGDSPQTPPSGLDPQDTQQRHEDEGEGPQGTLPPV